MVVKSIRQKPVQDASSSSTRFTDRWFWVSMATLLIIIVLAGFIPDSIRKINAIQLQQRDPFPLRAHLHAIVMGSWLLLLLAQTLLIGTGHRRWHISLGSLSLVVAPLVSIMMIAMAAGSLASISAASPDVSLENISRRFAFVLTVQGRAIVLFSIFFLWAFRTRLTKPETHKRMMILATWSMIDAGIARIPGSRELGTALGLRDIGFTSGDDIPHFWMMLTISPALAYDIIQRGRIHYAWVVGIAMFLTFAVTAHYLESTPLWWQQFVGEIMGRK